jgi:hypothetical protein
MDIKIRPLLIMLFLLMTTKHAKSSIDVDQSPFLKHKTFIQIQTGLGTKAFKVQKLKFGPLALTTEVASLFISTKHRTKDFLSSFFFKSLSNFISSGAVIFHRISTAHSIR